MLCDSAKVHSHVFTAEKYSNSTQECVEEEQQAYQMPMTGKPRAQVQVAHCASLWHSVVCTPVAPFQYSNSQAAQTLCSTLPSIRQSRERTAAE